MGRFVIISLSLSVSLSKFKIDSDSDTDSDPDHNPAAHVQLPLGDLFCNLTDMKNLLAIDIGAGTMDILCYVPGENMHYKAVVQSPVRTIARRVAATRGNLVVDGVEMGGGPVTEALRARAETHRVTISSAAAATVHHDPDRVKAMGLHIVTDEAVDKLQKEPGHAAVTLGDLEPDRIQRIVEGFGLPFEFEAVAICAQDHGAAPPGFSHLEYRHQLFKARLDRRPYPHTLLFSPDNLPKEFNRLGSIARTAGRLPTEKVFVMDSGQAAILGASLDPSLTKKRTFMVLDIATSHTVGAVMSEGKLQGSFEYHTRDIDLGRLEQLLRDLPEGRLEHTRILKEGGHGAYLRSAVGYDAIEAIVATGPKRRLLSKSSLPIIWGAPWGDNMMTGCTGLIDAVRRALNMDPIEYI